MMEYSTDEVMTVVAARELADGVVCFVGIGLPSEAANLARLTHAPNCVLIYESGTIDTRPDVLPLSIGDDGLARTAAALVSVPEVFNYWLQAGRVDVGFLGAAQVDRHGNINTTVIGDYRRPRTRLPGAGGAPEIAASATDVVLVLRQSERSFVEALSFTTSVGHHRGGESRRSLGARGNGPRVIITDLGVLRPDPVTREFTLTALHPGVTVEQARAATGWELAVADVVETTAAPTATELDALRDLRRRTREAHA